ncbi:MAG TPA: TonB-dependent receptor [Steroidobacteraceae bacterium]|nr:TonB-dependent receptor [Steroidobacteraceae bacterium]HRX90368.1 TonB-dependent receptor [Steroidobacteraceae bacterium]
MIYRKHDLVCVLIAALAVAVANDVHAQQAAEQPGIAGLEEVVVTARKQQETLLEVPVAVTALTAADIESKGIESLQDVANFTPGLTYFDAIQSQLGTPVIRGISQTNLNSPDRNVAIFYGGVYLSSTSAANLDILDVERIEVVKGPQSALYGRNAFNGAINFVPAMPTSDLYARIEATAGTDNRREGKFTVSTPLGERAGVRFTAGYNSFDGTYDNAATNGPNIGGYETKSASLTFRAEPIDGLGVRLFGFYTDDQRDPSALYFMDTNNCGPNPMALTAFCGEVPYRDTIAQNELAEGFTREVRLGALDLDYQVGKFKLVSQTSLYEATTEAFTEYTANGVGDAFAVIRLADFQAAVAMGVPATTAWLTAPVVRTERAPQFTGSPPADTTAFSQELRLESDQTQRLRGSIGAFYYKNESTSYASASIDGRALAPGETYRDSLLFTLGNPGIVQRTDPRTLFVTTQLERTDYQRAYFATFEYDIGDTLTLGGELRTDTEDRQQFNATVGPASLQRAEFEYNTWRYHADYAFRPTQRFYFSVAKGVISGYFNPTVDAATRLPLPVELQTYQPAINRTYELGWKAEWLDKRLATELILFNINYKGLQINATPPPPAVTAIIQNLGNVRSRGIEAAASFALTDKWRVGMTYGYSPTEFGQDSVEPSILRYCGGQAQLALGFCPTTFFRGVLSPEVGGQSLPRAPELNASGNIAFETPIAGGDWSLFARADASYVGKAYTLTYNIAEIPARTLVNARLGVRRGKSLEVSLWGRNVLDEEYPTAVIFQPHFNQPIGIAFTPNVSQGEGATFGLTASYRFGVDR